MTRLRLLEFYILVCSDASFSLLWLTIGGDHDLLTPILLSRPASSNYRDEFFSKNPTCNLRLFLPTETSFSDYAGSVCKVFFTAVDLVGQPKFDRLSIE